MCKEKDLIILRQEKKIEELSRKLNALEQENALLEYENKELKRKIKNSKI